MSEKLEWNMGNEDKVKKKDLVSKTKSRFLPEAIVDTEKGRYLYSLDEEFAKSKQNKNIVFYLLILLFIVVVVGSTLLLTNYLEDKTKDFKISIKEFEDLRLRDVLDSASKKSDNVDVVSIQLQILEIQMLDSVLDVKRRYHDREIATIVKNLSDKETDGRIKEIRRNEVRAIRNVRAKYYGLIRGKRAELANLRRAKAKAAKNLKDKERVITNRERLYELRTKQLKSAQDKGTRLLKNYADKYRSYITQKYNPRFRSSELNSILESQNYKMLNKDGTLDKDFNKLFGTERITGRSNFRKIKKRIENQNRLLKRLLRIPYINSVYPALEQIELLSKSITYEYEKEIRKRDREIRNFQHAFNYILNSRPENGYIIDSRNPNNINVYVLRLYRVKNGETALVFRAEDEYIGKIQFVMMPYGMRAKTIEVAKNKKIMPFDKILLEVKR